MSKDKFLLITHHSSLITFFMIYPNIYTLFRARVERFRALDGEGKRSVFFVRQDGVWNGIAWAQFDDDVHDFASALLAHRLTHGASVRILMGNVTEWPVADLGTVAAGGVGVGLYPTSSAEQCRYIIDHSDAEFVLVDTRAQLEKILSLRGQLPKVKVVIALDESAARAAGEDVLSYAEFMRRGREARERFAPELKSRAEAARPDDTAIMVYTSGTTGQPKGACLSHRYIINSVESLRETTPVDEDDTSFSYLPYCHVAERIAGLYNRLYAGASAYFVDDVLKLGQYMLEVRPTIFASLPRFFEKIHARVVADLEKLPPEERAQFDEAIEKGREVVRRRQAREAVPQELLDDYERNCLPRLARVKEYFGGRIRLATSGGAPLPQEIAEFFAAAGIPILQAYGLTENVCVAFNRPDNYKFGTVGPPMPMCEVRIEPDGEILVRSQMMFSGYYKEPEKTAEVLRDGWLLTGDLGEIDADGFLKITGRKKELIVLSTGKNVAPLLIENMIKEHHFISQAFIYGDGRSYLVALITLNPVEVAEYARARDINHQSMDELARDERINALVSEVVERVNRRVSSSESIKKFLILSRDFLIEREEVTPTLKIKRDVVTKNFWHEIQNLYA